MNEYRECMVGEMNVPAYYSGGHKRYESTANCNAPCCQQRRRRKPQRGGAVLRLNSRPGVPGVPSVPNDLT